MKNLNRYEGLFILNTVGKDEGAPEILDQIESEIKSLGGKVDSIQKMDRRPFARPSRKMSSGYYANILFQGPSDICAKLRTKFRLDDRVYRMLFQVQKKTKQPKTEKTENKESVKSRG